MQFEHGFIGPNLDLQSNLLIEIDNNNQIISVEESRHEIKNQLLATPGFFNAHVHSADIGLRGHEIKTFKKMVGPNGIKEKHLQSLSCNQLKEAINQSYNEAIYFGVLGWADFREGGYQSINQYPLRNSGNFVALGRPKKGEIELNILKKFSGVGIRDVNAYTSEELNIITNFMEQIKGRKFIHVSEDLELRNYWIKEYGHSDVSWVLENYKFDALVHLTNATEDEFEQMTNQDVGAIFCVGSNQITRVGKPDINSALENDVLCAIGTDNAMFQPLSLLNEFRKLQNYRIDSQTLLQMATVNGARLAGRSWGILQGSSNFLGIKFPDRPSSDLYTWLVKECHVANIVERYY